MVSDGCTRGRGAPTTFNHLVRDVRVIVHVDDFTFAGTEVELRKVQAKMREWHDVKVRGTLGSARRDQQDTAFWGRALRCADDGLWYGVDVKRRQALLACQNRRSRPHGRRRVDVGRDSRNQERRDIRRSHGGTWEMRARGDEGLRLDFHAGKQLLLSDLRLRADVTTRQMQSFP